MPAPRLPASWYSAKGAVIGALLAVGVFWLMANHVGSIGVLIASPLIASAAAVPILVCLEWTLGRGQRAYRFGTGRQERWGYLGHDIRGVVAGGRIWISLADCEFASGLDLSPGLAAVPASWRRKDDVSGLMLDMRGMDKLLGACADDFSRVARFRVFLERTVWRIPRD